MGGSEQGMGTVLGVVDRGESECGLVLLVAGF